jgi:hypothetical protein
MKKLLIVFTALSTTSMVFAKFNDIPAGHWAEKPVENVTSKKILNGYPNGNFGGSNSVNRYELATSLSNTLTLLNKEIENDRQDLASLLEIMELFQNEMAEIKQQLKINTQMLSKISNLEVDAKNTSSASSTNTSNANSNTSASTNATTNNSDSNQQNKTSETKTTNNSAAKNLEKSGAGEREIVREVIIKPRFWEFWKKPRKEIIYKENVPANTQSKADLKESAELKAKSEAASTNIETNSQVSETNSSDNESRNLELAEEGSLPADNSENVPTSRIGETKYKGKYTSNYQNSKDKDYTDYSLDDTI